MALASCRHRVLTAIVGVFLSAGYAGAATELASPPPENAALLYYQALARVGHPQFQIPPGGLTEVIQNIEKEPPSPSMRQFVKGDGAQGVVGLVLLATRGETSDWGFTASEDWTRLCTASLLSGRLAPLVMADAWVLAADGKYRPSLEAALALRRLARHMGDDDFIMWDVGVDVEIRALRTIDAVLGWMPPNEETLVWLEKELAADRGPQWRPRISLTKWGDRAAQYVSPDEFAFWKKHIVTRVKDDALRTELEGVTKAEAVRRAHQVYMRYVDSVVRILESEGSYQTTMLEFWGLDGDVWRDLNNPIIYALGESWTQLGVTGGHYYDRHIRRMANIHAVRMAIQIYRVTAQTGQLPKELPKVSWMDPYGGEDFQYEITDDGFTLRCGPASRPDTYAPPREFHFKVAKEAGR